MSFTIVLRLFLVLLSDLGEIVGAGKRIDMKCACAEVVRRRSRFRVQIGQGQLNMAHVYLRHPTSLLLFSRRLFSPQLKVLCSYHKKVNECNVIS